MTANEHESNFGADDARYGSSYYSDDDRWRIVIKDIAVGGSGRYSFENYSNIYVKKLLNRMSVFRINFEYVTAADKTWIKEGNDVFIYKNEVLQLKGRITRVTLNSDYGGVIEGNGKEVLLFKDFYYDATNNTFRKEWSSETVTNIATALIGSIMDVGTINAYGTITGWRNENDNRLRNLMALARNIKYDWYVSEAADGDDQFNLVARRGEVSSQQTFTKGDEVLIVDDMTDKDNVFNKIIVVGYGDGDNQLLSVGTHYTYRRTTLSAAINATATTIGLTDVTGFDISDGYVWIGMEYVTYTGITGNNLTGCTRGVSSLYSIDAYAHDAGISVIRADYTESSPETGTTDPDTSSSAHVYGVRSTSYPDKSIIDQNTLDRLSQRLIDKYYKVITRIKFDCLVDLTSDIGDTVTLVDDVLGIDTTYQLIGIERVFGLEGDGTVIELSDSHLTWFEELEDMKSNLVIDDSYGQGATNIIQMIKEQNADSTHGVKIRFYIPDEAVAVNKIKCSYDIDKYRVDSTVSAGEATHTHITPAHQHKLFLYDETSSAGVVKKYFFSDGSVTSYPIYLTTTTAVDIYNYEAGGGATSGAGASHVHDQAYGIGEDAGGWSVSDMTVEVDGVDKTTEWEAENGTLVVTEGGTDSNMNVLTSWFSGTLAGAWHSIEFIPDANCRLDINLMVQCWIKSQA